MTLIRPYSPQELALKEQVHRAAKKADLSLSETLALNKKFGLNLEYTPKHDTVILTTYIKKGAKRAESFIKECQEEAQDFGGIVAEHIKISSKGSFATNVSNALKKLKEVL